MLGDIANVAFGPGLYDKLPYDPVKDYEPITLIATSPNVLVAHPSVKATNMKELIALAKAKPGQLNYSSPGAGTLSLAELARVPRFENAAHHEGSRKTENSIFAPIPTAHTRPKLAIPGLLEQPSAPNPAIAVPPHNSNARPIERRTRPKSPPCRRNANCMNRL